MTTLTTSFFSHEMAVSCMRRDAERIRKSRKKETKLLKGLKWNQKTKQNKTKYHLEQIDLDLKAKMEYEQKITLGISRSVGTNIVHSFL